MSTLLLTFIHKSHSHPSAPLHASLILLTRSAVPRVCIHTPQPPWLPPHSQRSLSRGTLVLPAVTPRVVSATEPRAGLPLDCLAAGDGPDDSWQPPAKHDHAVAAFHNILSCVAGMWYTGSVPFLPSSTSTPSLCSLLLLPFGQSAKCEAGQTQQPVLQTLSSVRSPSHPVDCPLCTQS